MTSAMRERFEGGDDAFQPRQLQESIESRVVFRIGVFHALALVQPGMLGPTAA